MTNANAVINGDVETSIPDRDLHTCLQELAQQLTQRGWMMATAESCTGGMIAAACTDLPGSSRWFDRGFVTYSNAAKTEMLGVPAELIEKHGAVSEEVARAMAEGAVQRAGVQIAVAVTGIAGPDGGTKDKPVGTVWCAWKLPARIIAKQFLFAGSRSEIRNASCEAILEKLAQLLPPITMADSPPRHSEDHASCRCA